MEQAGARILERIGQDGLLRALRCTFDRLQLLDLARACGLRFPGESDEAIGNDWILREMVRLFVAQADSRIRIMEALTGANEELIARLAPMRHDALAAAIGALADDDAGRALFVLACGETGDDEIPKLVRRLRGGQAPRDADPREPSMRPQQESGRRDRSLEQETLAARDEVRRLRDEIAALDATVESLRREILEIRRQRAEADLRRPALARRGIGSTGSPSDPQEELGRVALFVDVQNMYYAARPLNARLDFSALMTAATRHRRLVRAIAYVVQNRDTDQSGFLAMLQQKNYEVRRKDLRIRHDGSSKGDWDMEMALDMLRMADSLDVVVLVSGDGDFVPLVTQIRTLGPRVEVYSFPGSTAKELIQAADRHVPIDEALLIRMSPSA